VKIDVFHFGDWVRRKGRHLIADPLRRTYFFKEKIRNSRPAILSQFYLDNLSANV
jgi:hypothetical protein